MRICCVLLSLLASFFPLGCGTAKQFRDTTAYVQYLVDRGQVVPPGTYILRRSIVVRNSNTIVQGAGSDTIFVFRPDLPQQECWNDRAFTTSCDTIYDSGTKAWVNRRRISNPIAIGDTSFQTTDDASDLRPGDWIIVSEKDIMIRDVVIVDWARVSFAVGHTVYVTTPFRTAFPNTRTWDPLYGGLGFYKVVNPIENVQFRDFTLEVPDAGESAPGISVFAARSVVVDHVNVTDDNGQAFYSYQSKDVTFVDCSGFGSSEFAATVDLTLSGNKFGSDNGVGFGLDVGTGFFSVTGNSILSSSNIGMYMLYGSHDGIVRGNYIAFVSGSGNSVGIAARGMQNVTITDNTLAGGAGPHSMGISVGPTGNLEVELPSSGNVISPNTFGDWAMDYDPGNQI